jgi:xanthine dehydrogenase accessory factor
MYTLSSRQTAGIAPERLQRVHAPIGLEIGALTPEEIAVSIVGQMIQVRRESYSPRQAAGNTLAGGFKNGKRPDSC